MPSGPEVVPMPMGFRALASEAGARQTTEPPMTLPTNLLIPSILAALSLSAACGGAGGGVPEDCEIEVDGQCYSSTTEACAAAGCPVERCDTLRSYPAQVECHDGTAPTEEGTTAGAGGEVVATTTTAAPGAEGSPCAGADECGEGLFCDGAEGCDVPWACQPFRPCTRDLVTYCGCDGETFQGGGNCPGRPFASRGPCDADSAE